ncbi:MAG: ribosomal large subunit methyltransferase [Candidatus Parcubacteria bacterium]|jgi:23S rRNA (cytidine1920-2'-O)/16S rRNA (cytidine1409-2'-O)-methyltransferase
MENNTSPEHKNRLDVEMHSRGLARSRSNAVDLIKRGKVKINGKVVTKASVEVGMADTLSIETPEKFVSRAGEKLEHALSVFKVDVKDLTAVDIGSSTGGFTDCLLQHGARKVIAIDVGTDQLVAELRNDPRVEVHEGSNVRSFVISEQVDIAVIDVSFISLTLVLPKAYEFLKDGGLLKKGGTVVALVKPQFEVGMETAKKHRGVITSEGEHREVLERVKKVAKEIGFKVVNETISPIEGEKGNKEFLLLLKK